MGPRITKARIAVNRTSLAMAAILSGRASVMTSLDFGAAAMTCQTFSISGLPRMPCGRKINTAASMAKAATSLYSMEK